MAFSRNIVIKLAATLAVGGVLAGGSALAGPAIYTPPFSKLALEGHDPVAYFDAARPVKGDPKIATVFKGVEYRFASVQHRARFLAQPNAFLPQYGGHCAWAVSNGYTAKGDPKVWKIVGGKLYLNYDAKVQSRWEADIPGHIARADRNWPGLHD